jgi:uncharacterized membrane protein YeaQ/YmgE (transglycosylase-associated protein family)
VAPLLMPGPNAGGVKVAIPLGIVAALAGGLAGSAMAGELSMQIDSRSMLMAMISAMLVLFSYRSLAMRGKSP